jgi:hypothetical protein
LHQVRPQHSLHHLYQPINYCLPITLSYVEGGYGDLHLDPIKRREHLKENYFFDCYCSACVKDLNLKPPPGWDSIKKADKKAKKGAK